MRSFQESIYRSRFPITLEAPLIRDHSSLHIFVKYFKDFHLSRWVIGINILNNPLGRISPDPIILGGIIQKETGVEAIPHIVSSVENKYTLYRWLLGASFLNINNLLLMSGDIKIKECLSYDESLNIINMFSKGVVDIDVNKLLLIPRKNFFVGGVIIPWRRHEFSRVEYKLKNNIRFFQTQIIMDIEQYKETIFSLDKFVMHIVKYKVPVLTGFIPSLNKNIIEILNKGGVYLEYPYKGEYVNHVKKMMEYLLDISQKTENLILGIHIIPILWDEDIINNILSILEGIY